MIEAQAGTGGTEGAAGEGQSGLAASTALIEKILAEEPSWQGAPSGSPGSDSRLFTSRRRCLTALFLPVAARR